MNKLLAATSLTGAASLAAAHGGHGLAFAHWHATDVWGFVALGAVAALIFWIRRGK
jgi:hypothetical protein